LRNPQPNLCYGIAYSSTTSYIDNTQVCGQNNYEINLYECANGGAGFTLIDTIPIGTTCYASVNFPRLRTCPDATFFSTITNIGGGGNPVDPVYVEWYWIWRAIVDPTGDIFYYTGKMVFVATPGWLKYTHGVNGGSYTGGIYNIGLPLLNQTNHTNSL
jgi:hypothetical protein